MGQRAVHAKGGIRMIRVSQNKERVLWFGRAFNALEYEEECYTNEFFDQSAQAQRPATYRKNIVYQFPEK